MEEAPQPGALVAGRYVVDAVLGAGGMGVVCRARDQRLERWVALKVLNSSGMQSASARARMVREARAAAALEHPNIVRVYDVGEDAEGRAFLVMELVRGRSVAQLAAAGALPAAESVRIITEVARGLGAAHRAGLIHRDVKPENVMVRDTGEVIVLDLGLARGMDDTAESRSPEVARASTRVTDDGTIVGTLAYLSPEQAYARPLDGATDQFSLAVMAFELFSGRLPWQGDTPTAVLASMLTQDPPSLRALVPALPEGVDAIFARALSREPRARFETIEGFADALASLPGWRDAMARTATAAVVAPGPAAIHAPTLEMPGNKPAKSRRRTGTAALFVLVAGLLAAGYVGLRARSARRGAGVAVGSPLASRDARLACVVFETEGDVPPSGWLGAAAGSYVCDRARWILGGRAERTLAPAQLLDVPTSPNESIPADVYASPEARTRSLRAARALADAYVDGRVTRSERGFRVALHVVARDGRELGHATADGESFYDAVRAAMDPVVREGAIPRVSTLDASVLPWVSPRILEVEDLRRAMESQTMGPSDCVRWDAMRVDLGSAWSDYRSCGLEPVHGGRPEDGPAVDRGSPGALAATSVARAQVDPSLDPNAAATEVHEALQHERSALGRAVLGHAEGSLRSRALDERGAGDALLAAVQLQPRDPRIWDDLADVIGMVDRALPKGYSAWFPDEGYAWIIMSNANRNADPVAGAEYARRAFVLAPRQPYVALVYGLALERAARWADVRALGATLAAGEPILRATGELLLAQVDAHDGRFAAALRRARAALRDSVRALPYDYSTGPDYSLLRFTIALGAVLGLDADVADEFARETVLQDPPRLDPQGVHTYEGVWLACAVASRPVATACVTRLRALQSARFFTKRDGMAESLADGAEQWIQGNTAAAADALRPIAREQRWSEFLARVFERAGRDDLADRVDAPATSAPGEFRGVNMAYVRAAERASRRGDRDTAVRLARAVIDAWSDADADVPAIARMRAIAAR